MNRAADRRKTKEIKKKVKDMSTGELDKLLHDTIGDALEEGHTQGFRHCMMAVEKALREEFGFGPKRMDRLIGKLKQIAEAE